MMLCDLIENTSPTILMTALLNAAGISPTRQSYLKFKNTIAAIQRQERIWLYYYTSTGFDYSRLGFIYL